MDNHNESSGHSKANDSTAEIQACVLFKDCGDGVSTEGEVTDTKTFLSLSCQTCGKFFNGRSQLRQHAKVCQIDFHCQNCGKVFTRSSYKSSSTFRHSTGIYDSSFLYCILREKAVDDRLICTMITALFVLSRWDEQ